MDTVISNLEASLTTSFRLLSANYVNSILITLQNGETTKRNHMYYAMTQTLIICRMCDFKAKYSAALHEMKLHAIWYVISVNTLHQPTRT